MMEQLKLPYSYCMPGFSQAVLFFMLLQLFNYAGNHWYSKRKMFVMFSSQRRFTSLIGRLLMKDINSSLKRTGAIQLNKPVVKSAATFVSWKCTQRTQARDQVKHGM